MATKKTSGNGAKVAGRKNEEKVVNITANELQTVNASGLVPTGSGTTGGGAPAAVSVGSSEASTGKAGCESSADRLAAAVDMENEMGLNELRQKIVGHFSAPEWDGATALRETLRGLGLDETAVNAAVTKQAIACGWVPSAPVVSVARVLVVVRRHYLKEFERLTGVSVDAVREYYRGVPSLSSWSPRLSLSAVRADSDFNNFLMSAEVPAGSSATAVVAAVLSVRFVFAFRRALSAARSEARTALRSSLASCWRAGVRLGMSTEDILKELEDVAFYTSISDAKERETLRRNRNNAWNQINNINDAILLAGGCDGPKAAKVTKLLARRARFASVAATCENLLK